MNRRITKLNKGVRTSLKKALGKKYRFLKIGYDYYYQGNQVTIIPIEISNHYYATVEIQSGEYTVTIDKIQKNTHLSYLSKYYRRLHTDNLESLGQMFNEYMDTIVL